MTDIEIFYVALFIFFVLPVAIVVWAVVADWLNRTDQGTEPNRPPLR
jgi:hypothetical protein